MKGNSTSTGANPTVVLAKALFRAADRLGVDDASLASIIGVSDAMILGYQQGAMTIDPSAPEGKQAVLLIGVLVALDVLVGAEEKQRTAWMNGYNVALDGVPMQVIQQPGGLESTLSYLDSLAATI